jgi:gluconolactonase
MEPEVAVENFEIFASGLDHPECVAFDSAGYLWAGGEAGQIYRIDKAGQVETILTMGGFCGGLAFSPTGELFVCNPAHGIVRVFESAAGDYQYEVFANSAGDHKLVTPNFGVFEARGYYYVTDSGKWKQPNGKLIRYSSNGTGKVIASGFRYPNGLALSADEKSLFMVESETNSVLRFSINADGSTEAPEKYASDCGRFPDGLALDSDGNLYVSCYASDDIHRVNRAGEKRLFAHDPWGILLGRPTNIAFGADAFMYIANLGRTTVTRAHVGTTGLLPAGRRAGS